LAVQKTAKLNINTETVKVRKITSRNFSRVAETMQSSKTSAPHVTALPKV